MEFGFHNDYLFFVPLANQPWAGFQETRFQFYIGRPVGALLLNLQMFTITGLTALKVWRGISWLLAAGSAVLLYTYGRRRLSLEHFWAAALAFGFLTMPPVQVYVLWATNVVPGTFNIFFSLCIYGLLDAAAPDGLNSLFVGRRRLLLAVVAFLLLLVAFAIYPPTALFPLVLTAARVVFAGLRGWPASRRIVWRDVCLFLAAAAIYFLLMRAVIVPILEQLHLTNPPGRDVERYQFGVGLDPGHWLRQFMELTRVALAGSWGIFWGAKASRVVGPLLALGLVATTWRVRLSHRRMPGKGAGPTPSVSAGAIAGMVAAVLALVALANLPLLAARGAAGFAPYRSLAAYFGILVVLQSWMIWRWSQASGRWAEFAAGILLLAAGAVALINVTNVSQDLALELGQLQRRLSAVDLSQVRQGLFIDSREWHYPTRQRMINDFGLRMEEPNMLLGMVRALYGRCANWRSDFSVALVPFADTYYVSDDRVIVADMAADAGTQSLKTWPPRMAWSRAEPGSADGPPHVDVDYARPASVVAYVLDFGAPTDPPEAKVPGWKLMGSYAGKTWEKIDSVPPGQPWNTGQSKSFTVPEGTHYSKYRFEFERSREPMLTLQGLRLLPHAAPRVDDLQAPRIIIQRYRGFNIYAAGEAFIALGCEEGPLEVKQAVAQGYSRCWVAASVRELKWQIDNALGFANATSTVDYSDQDFLGVSQ